MKSEAKRNQSLGQVAAVWGERLCKERKPEESKIYKRQRRFSRTDLVALPITHLSVIYLVKRRRASSNRSPVDYMHKQYKSFLFD